jgi:hypothetical protein
VITLTSISGITALIEFSPLADSSVAPPASMRKAGRQAGAYRVEQRIDLGGGGGSLNAVVNVGANGHRRQAVAARDDRLLEFVADLRQLRQRHVAPAAGRGC